MGPLVVAPGTVVEVMPLRYWHARYASPPPDSHTHAPLPLRQRTLSSHRFDGCLRLLRIAEGPGSLTSHGCSIRVAGPNLTDVRRKPAGRLAPTATVSLRIVRPCRHWPLSFADGRDLNRTDRPSLGANPVGRQPRQAGLGKTFATPGSGVAWAPCDGAPAWRSSAGMAWPASACVTPAKPSGLPTATVGARQRRRHGTAPLPQRSPRAHPAHRARRAGGERQREAGAGRANQPRPRDDPGARASSVCLCPAVAPGGHPRRARARSPDTRPARATARLPVDEGRGDGEPGDPRPGADDEPWSSGDATLVTR
jgi:hypothetical protein